MENASKERSSDDEWKKNCAKKKNDGDGDV